MSTYNIHFKNKSSRIIQIYLYLSYGKNSRDSLTSSKVLLYIVKVFLVSCYIKEETA